MMAENRPKAWGFDSPLRGIKKLNQIQTHHNKKGISTLEKKLILETVLSEYL
jgi:hypothetical protein